MLAWMHQAIVSEEEFLNAVFLEGASRAAQEEEEGHSSCPGLTIPELLGRSLQGLGRPLRMRIIQALEGRGAISALYSLHDLLTFYESTFLRLSKGVENSVHSAVKGCLHEAKRVLTLALNRQAEALLASSPSYPIDLSPTEVTLQCVRQMADVLKVHATALSPSADELDTCSITNVLGYVNTTAPSITLFQCLN